MSRSPSVWSPSDADAAPMTRALAEAEAAAAMGEVPVGAVIVAANGTVLAQDHNRIEERSDPTAHAEILVIRAAAARLGTPRLVECDLYVTLEPCPMCAMAASLARLRRIYFGAEDPKGGGIEPKEAPDGRALFYMNINSPYTLRRVSPDGGDEVVVLKGIIVGQWAVPRVGIVFVTMGRDYDELDFYSFSDGSQRRLGRLPEKVSRVAAADHLRVSGDRRWALIGVTETYEADIMVAEAAW